MYNCAVLVAFFGILNLVDADEEVKTAMAGLRCRDVNR